MSRFFKSAAFPILIVVVLAFLAVKLVNEVVEAADNRTLTTTIARYGRVRTRYRVPLPGSGHEVTAYEVTAAGAVTMSLRSGASRPPI